MAEHSKIEWTDSTWNPCTGCTKVSAGCAHCYAEAIINRREGAGAFDTVVLHPDRLELPLHWRKPRRIFVNSMSDLFHPAVPDEFIDSVFAVMAVCSEHFFQVLTKRPARMLDYLTKHAFESGPNVRCLELTLENNRLIDSNQRGYHWPLPNVMLVISAENQPTANQRMPVLLQCPAALRGVSLEPLLGPIDLTRIDYGWLLRETLQKASRFEGLPEPTESDLVKDGVAFLDVLTGKWFDGWDSGPDGKKLDSVIVGGESGDQARPMHPGWPRALRDQCVEARIPFFFKQWGEWLPGTQARHLSDAILSHINVRPLVHKGVQTFSFHVGRDRAGRLLDRTEWNQMPTIPRPGLLFGGSN